MCYHSHFACKGTTKKSTCASKARNICKYFERAVAWAALSELTTRELVVMLTSQSK